MVVTLAKFFKIGDSSQGLKRLMKLLYKIKNKIDQSWVDILNLRASMIVFSIKERTTEFFRSHVVKKSG